MKKIIALLFAFVIIILPFASCTSPTNTGETGFFYLPLDDRFEFIVYIPRANLTIGETITFVARLVNLTDEEITIGHAMPLIHMEFADYDAILPYIPVFAILQHTQLDPNGYVERTINVRGEGEGDFVFRSAVSFRINGQDFFTSEIFPINVR